MSNSKIVIAVDHKRIEIEGTQEFIELKLPQLLAHLNPTKEELDSDTDPKDTASNTTSRLSLRKLFETKSPKNAYEAIAVVLFHAQKFKNLQEMNESEIRAALIMGKFRPPGSMPDALKDCRRRYGYIEAGEQKGYWKLSADGETVVELDLPKEK